MQEAKEHTLADIITNVDVCMSAFWKRIPLLTWKSRGKKNKKSLSWVRTEIQWNIIV
jgi:hypothetical protein